MKILKTVIFGAIVFVGAFAYFAPASIIQKFLPGNISTAGISGTIWSGNAQTIVVNQIGIQNTKWSANPLSLLTGKIQADVSIDSPNLKGQFETTYTGSAVRARDLLLNGDLSLLMPYFEIYGLTINGQFDADFEKLDIENGVPQQVDGTLQTYNTNILGILPLKLGDITSVFEQQVQGMQISLNNINGELDLNGVITIDANGTYLADLTLSRNAHTPDQVLQTVQMLGRKIGENSVKLTHSGQLRI